MNSEFKDLARDVLLQLCAHEQESAHASGKLNLPQYEKLLGTRAVRIAEGFFEALVEREKQRRAELALTPEEIELVMTRNKIAAIKSVRERTGLTLKEAKAFVDKQTEGLS